jgi:hypothetical protein
MKARSLAVVLFPLVMLCGCFSYHVVEPSHAIGMGQVIQKDDLLPLPHRWEAYWSPQDVVTDESQIIGHKALVDIRPGRAIRMRWVSK